MSYLPNFAEFTALAQSHKRVAVACEILADRFTPMSLCEIFSKEMQDGALLESGFQRSDTGRYSFLAFAPMASLKTVGKNCYLERNGETIQSNDAPLTALRQLLDEYTCGHAAATQGLAGGAIGYLSYDAIRLFENIPDQHAQEAFIPDIHMRFYRHTLCYDHEAHKLLVCTIVETSSDPATDYQYAQDNLNRLIEKIHAPYRVELDYKAETTTLSAEITTDISDEAFIQKILQAQEYIRAGDAFQIVLSRNFSLPYRKAFDVYRALRKTSKAPYMFYLPQEQFTILGASPEKMVHVHAGKITMHPIAGTRPRSDDLAAISADLLADPKECAEHTMLVDLARNDLGRISHPGTVQVQEYMTVKHYTHVSHITSTVTGQLADSCDALDALAATLPAGTLSGAPKIRAMEIIDELETSRRGLYGGIICRIHDRFEMDSCIAIRMAVLRDGIAQVRAGCGVVHLSDPQLEADETRHKARTVLEAITLANRGLI